MISILIVEDEAPIRELLRISLKEAGYECTCAGDGDEAADILIQKRFDLVLLDIMLPGANGYELLEFVRPMEIPVIFLTAKGEVADKVKGLRMGAEDYITKPFELAELLARVETVLRRYHKAEEILACGAVKVDLRSHRVTRNSEPVSLTAKEYELLVLFLRNKNIREIVVQLTFMFSASAKNSGWRSRSLRYIRLDTVWRRRNETVLENIFQRDGGDDSCFLRQRPHFNLQFF